MSKQTLSITDNRTGKSYEVDITDGTIRALDLRQIKVDDDDFGLMTYDPGFSNTASCKSRVTFIDGEKGILRHRGYAIEDLAAKPTGRIGVDPRDRDYPAQRFLRDYLPVFLEHVDPDLLPGHDRLELTYRLGEEPVAIASIPLGDLPRVTDPVTPEPTRDDE